MEKKDSFADSVAQHLPYLNRMVGLLTRNDPLADDIVQQTVVKALIHVDQFRFESTLKTWLTSIAMNEIRQSYRCGSRSRSVPLTLENLESYRSPRNESPSPSYQMQERDALVRKAVSRLPEPYRCVVELCELQDLSLKEVATRLRLTLAAVKSRRHRARNKLRPLVLNLRP